MGVSSRPGWFARTAVAGAHVLIVEVPGWALTRIAVERAVTSRGWRPALTPADADLLVVCGDPGEPWRPVIDRLWAQMPGPRALVRAAGPEQVAEALEFAAATLLRGGDENWSGDTTDARGVHGDDDHAGSRASHGGDSHDSHEDGDRNAHGGGHDDEGHEHHHRSDHDASNHDGSDHDGSDHDGSDHDASDHDGSDHDGSDHDGSGGEEMHGDMDSDMGDMDMGDTDMGDMDMPMPGGIPLAGGDEDRDGLEMDVLSVPLGPVLPAWPAGLVLRCVLHGDVIARVETSWLPGADPPPGPPVDGRVRAALDCDGVARLLILAGSDRAARGFRDVRDALLDGAPLEACSAAAASWAVRVRRSRTLRWSMRGLGGIDQSELDERGLPDVLVGDVHDRLLARATGIANRLTSGSDGAPANVGALAGGAVDVIPALVTGLDLGAARLVVASVDPDIAALQRRGAARG